MTVRPLLYFIWLIRIFLLLYLFTSDPYAMFHTRLSNAWHKNCQIWPKGVTANTCIILPTLSTPTGDSYWNLILVIKNTSPPRIHNIHESTDDTEARLDYGHRRTLNVIQYKWTNESYSWLFLEIKQNNEKQKLYLCLI